MPPKKKSDEELLQTPLIPMSQFTEVVGRVLNKTKKKSDRQMDRFQASNKAKRERRDKS